MANKGLARYKSRWGTTESSLEYIRMPEMRSAHALSEFSKPHLIYKGLLRVMPRSVNRMFGELIYKHLA
jgi:hypothetical protein